MNRGKDLDEYPYSSKSFEKMVALGKQNTDIDLIRMILQIGTMEHLQQSAEIQVCRIVGEKNYERKNKTWTLTKI